MDVMRPLPAPRLRLAPLLARPRRFPRRPGPSAPTSWALAVAAAASASSASSSSSTCWIEGYSHDLCCGPEHGPEGNSECWDERFQYESCCLSPEHEGGADVGLGSAEAAALERSFGAKLDAVLAENGASLEEMEEDLRQTILTPENRSMAGPLTRGFLALVLFRQGRPFEASQELHRFLSNDFSIRPSGIWVGPAAEGYHMHDVPFSVALVDFLRGREAQTVLDLGCGLGLYVRDLRAAGFRAGGFDGNPATSEITSSRCQQLDLSQEVDFGVSWDWVLSLEVAEHIPGEFEANFVGNLVRHARCGLVLSWGNQAGEGHVNLKPRAEVERLFAGLGFRSDPAMAEILRSTARLPWLQDTVVVLERDPPPSGAPCGR